MYDRRAAATALKWVKCKAAPRQYCNRFNDCSGCSYFLKSYTSSADSEYAAMLVEYIDELKKVLPAPSRWIDVASDLPPEGLEVLVCTPKGAVCAAERVRCIGKQGSYRDCEFLDKTGRRIPVDYWQPKPLRAMVGLNDEGDLDKIRETRKRLVDEYNEMMDARKDTDLD